MPVRSAALLLHRTGDDGVEVWIAHMGGPFWARKDEGAWSLPKGLVEPGDDDELTAARREFAEEMGVPAPDAPYAALGDFRASAKTIVVFAAETPDFALGELRSNTFELEWPPRSGRRQEFPEVDDAGWFTIEQARLKLSKGQRPILDALLASLGAS
ncbi:NUDIX domain-containing protein [Leifsonia sp. F6_8S_P_1B]|uniref:NUDIX domain-containing protein n=1 Tax=Leifsonia williamsii TaxID=3035919 RepID=A0ABT8KDM1_9MICO|nr:NUDIX domain-containing protein [Leifsonia williamsii]MDN4615282.1 NUDIX domain-containing protein [Leifsonia williamsii]